MLVPTLLLLLLVLVRPATGQDMVAIDLNGGLFEIDSHTLVANRLGPGTGNFHGLARVQGVCWTVDHSPFFYRFTRIDPVTGAATSGAITSAMVTLASDGTSLWCVTTGPAPSMLGRVDPTTGVVNALASWPFTYQGPTALAFHQGLLYGWDSFAGLVRFNPVTGAVISFPGPPASSRGVNWLCSAPDGRLLCGIQDGPSFDLGVVDPVSGQVARLGTIGTQALRGAVWSGGWWEQFGDGCADVAGPASLVLQHTGRLVAGTVVTAISTNHATATIGAMLCGLRTDVWSGHSLPWSLDPILGTVGCSLYVSIDASLLGTTPSFAPATLSFPFSIPPGITGAFYFQHATIGPLPGLTSWSNGVGLHLDRPL